MALWETIAFVLLGIAVILLPLVVIGVYAGKLQPRRQAAFLVLYGSTVFLLGIVVADSAEWISSKLAVDLILLIGGIAIGAYATWSFIRR